MNQMGVEVRLYDRDVGDDDLMAYVACAFSTQSINVDVFQHGTDGSERHVHDG